MIYYIWYIILYIIYIFIVYTYVIWICTVHVFRPAKIIEILWYTNRLTLFSRHVEGLQVECITGSRASSSRSSSVASHLRMELLEAGHLEFCKILRPANCDRRRRDVRLLSQSCWGDRRSNSQSCTVVTHCRRARDNQNFNKLHTSWTILQQTCFEHIVMVQLFEAYARFVQ